MYANKQPVNSENYFLNKSVTDLCYMILNIYIYAFSRRFYPKRLTVHSSYTFLISMRVPWELNPQPFVLLTQCATTEPQEQTWDIHVQCHNDAKIYIDAEHFLFFFLFVVHLFFFVCGEVSSTSLPLQKSTSLLRNPIKWNWFL